MNPIRLKNNKNISLYISGDRFGVDDCWPYLRFYISSIWSSEVRSWSTGYNYYDYWSGTTFKCRCVSIFERAVGHKWKYYKWWLCSSLSKITNSFKLSRQQRPNEALCLTFNSQYSPKWRWILFAIHLRTSQSARAKSDIYFCGIHLCLIALVWNNYWKREGDYFSWEAQTKI